MKGPGMTTDERPADGQVQGDDQDPFDPSHRRYTGQAYIGDDRFVVRIPRLNRVGYLVPVWMYQVWPDWAASQFIRGETGEPRVISLYAWRDGLLRWLETWGETFPSFGAISLVEIRRISGAEILLHSFPEEIRAAYLIETVDEIVSGDPGASWLWREDMMRMFCRDARGYRWDGRDNDYVAWYKERKGL